MSTIYLYANEYALEPRNKNVCQILQLQFERAFLLRSNRDVLSCRRNSPQQIHSSYLICSIMLLTLFILGTYHE